ncbi:MAG: hypothetical protein FWD49_05835 [Firmicutes bacterium]|nr:hypothetical protein [Bacillota bacterium]
MAYPVINRDEFYSTFHRYYTGLEQDFLNTQRYVAIDRINFGTYSDEYLKLLLLICSEIDTVLKNLCHRGINNDQMTIGKFYKEMTEAYPDFCETEVVVKGHKFTLKPWKEWRESNSPKWWQVYNKIKHKRTILESEGGDLYLKKANLEHTINALAALYSLVNLLYKMANGNSIAGFGRWSMFNGLHSESFYIKNEEVISDEQ